MRILPGLSLLFTALAVAACAPPPPVAPPAPPPPRPAETAPPAPARRSSGLQVVFDLKKTPIPVSIGEASLDLQPLRGRTFVTIQDVIFTVDGDTLRSDPALQRGISDMPPSRYMRVELGAMGGQWPDAAWVQVNHIADRAYHASFLRWSGEEWVDAVTATDGIATRILPLANQWSAVLSKTAWSYAGDPSKRMTMIHPRRAVPMRDLGGVDAAAALSDGTLVTAVDGKVSAWAPDGSRRPMPSPSYGTRNLAPVISELVVLSPTSIFLLNTRSERLAELRDVPKSPDPPRPERQLLSFDGQSWRIEHPPGPAPDRIFAGPRGTLWAAHEGEHHERAVDGTWSALEVPARLDQVWVAGDDDVWATSEGNLLLHTRPLPAGVNLAAMVPPGEPPRFGDECPSLTALLDEVPRTAPVDFDFRARLDAWKPTLGKLAPLFAFYELPIAGKRRLVAHVPALGDVDGAAVRRVGEALVADAKGRGAPRPRLLCLEQPGEAEGSRLLRAAAPPRPAPARPAPRSGPTSLDGCASPMVVLFAPARTAPGDFDFPLTRKALRGHTELSRVHFFDFQRQGKRVIAATVSDKKEALALAELIKKVVPGSTPAPVCEERPRGAREISIDLATGNVKK